MMVEVKKPRLKKVFDVVEAALTKKNKWFNYEIQNNKTRITIEDVDRLKREIMTWYIQ